MKILKISFCGDCPHCINIDTDGDTMCDYLDIVMYHDEDWMYPIPENCPLEDYKIEE